MATVETIRRITTQARTEGVEAAAAALDRLARSSDGVTVATDRQERAMLNNQQAIDKASRAYTPFYAAQERLTKLSRELELAQVAGRMSQVESNRLYDAAVEKLTGYTRALEQAARAEIQARAAQNAAAQATASANQQVLNQRLNVRGDFGGEARAADFEAAAAAADRLRGKYDQVYAAAQTYGGALSEIASLQRAGVIATDVAIAARERETLAYEKQIYAMESVARQTAINSQRNIGLNLGFREAPDIEARGADMLAAIEDQDRLRAKYDQTFAAEQKLAAATREINALQASGGVDASAAARLIQTETDAYNRQIATLNGTVAAQEALARAAKAQSAASAEAARNAAEGWRKLGSSGADVLRTQASVSRLSNLSSDGSVAQINKAAASRRLRPDEAQNLTAQAIDVGVSLQGGMNPLTVLMQQGGQVAPIFAGPGGASVKGAFEQASEATSKFLSKIGPTGAAIAGIATVALTGAAALMSYASSQRELDRNLSGTGRASGATAGQINALAPEAGRAAGISTAAAREQAGSFASTGLIGAEMYSGLIKQVREYSILTGTDATEATKLFGASFGDPAAGALELNKRIGFLNFGMLENIRAMQESGNRLGAQKLLLEGIATATEGATAKLGFFARGWAEFSKNSSNEIDALGGFLSRGLGFDDAEARLKTLQAQLEFRTSRMGSAGGLFDRLLGFDIDTIRADIAKAQAEVDKAAGASKNSYLDQRSVEVGLLVKSLNPATAALESLNRRAADFQKSLNEGVPDPLGTTKRAMEGLLLQAKQFSSDMAAGGASFADATRAAQFSQRTVNYSPTGLAAAQIEEEARNRGIEALRRAGTNTTSQEYLASMQSIEVDRVTRLQTLDAQIMKSETAVGGVLSRLGPNLQKQILASTAGYGSVTPSLVAAIAGKESTNNLNVGYSKILGEDGRRSSAYGLGQITKGTAEEASRLGYLPPGYDRTDTATMAQGIAAVLQMKIDQNGGDVNKGIMAYRGSRDPNVNREYLTNVLRREGKLGDLSEEGVARDTDAQARAARAAAMETANLTRNYGLNGFEAEKTSRVNAALAEAAATGRDKIAGYTDSVTKSAIAAATAARDLTNTRAGRDLAFDREQLGRTSPDQQAYGRARSIYGDTSTPMSLAYIEQAKLNDNLRETKSLATDAFSSMLTDMRTGVTLGTSLSNITGRIADKLFSKAADSVMSNLFAGIGSAAKPSADGASGAGFMSIVKSMFGFADGGFTGYGGKMEPAGVVHRGEFVFDAASTARIGLTNLEAMRSTRRGWADGGYVGKTPDWATSPPANGPITLQLVNNGTPQEVEEVKETRDANGGRTIIAQTKDMVAATLSQPGSARDAARSAASNRPTRR